MTKLWIANTTKQHHEFVYRPKISDGGMKDGIIRPKYGDIRKHHIPLGGQVLVGDFDSDGEIRNILDQHKHIVEFSTLSKVKQFQGLCYKIGPDPVPVEKILERIDDNDKVRTEENRVRLVNTARDIATNMQQGSQTEGTPFKDLRETDVQVAQKGAEGVNKGTPQMNDVVEVVQDGKEPSRRGRQSAA